MSSWYDPAWTNRFPVTITNTETRGLAYFHVGLSFTGSAYTALHGVAKSDYSDLRVTDSDQVTLLNFWLEDTTTTNSVMLLVKIPYVPASTTKTIYVYCGNAAATSVSSATATILSAHIAPTIITAPSVIDNTSSASQWNGPGMIAQAANGKLVLLYSSGAIENFGKNGGLYVKTSTDNGATWSSRAQLIAPVTGTDVGPDTRELTRLANGTLIGWIVNSLDVDLQAYHANHYIIKSTDNGATWNIASSPFQYTTLSGLTAIIGGGHIIQLPNGDLLSPFAGIRTGDTKFSTFLVKCASTDDPSDPTKWAYYGGSLVAATMMRDASQTYDYDEQDIIQVSSTTFITAARKETGSFPIVIARSTDTLATWSAPVNLTDVTGFTGTEQLSPSFIALPNGVILLTAAERAAQRGGYYGMTSTITTDGGLTWSLQAMPSVINSGDLAYVTTCALANGTLYTAGPYHNGIGATLAGFIWDGDWAANPYGDYRDMSSTGVFTLGANAVPNTSIGHSGTNSIKSDNTAGHAATILYYYGNQNVGYPTQAVSVNYWLRIDAADSTGTFAMLLDGTAPANPGIRLWTSMADFAANGAPWDDKWYDGSVSYHDWTVAQTGAILSAAWFKQKLRMLVTSNTAGTGTGSLTQNNVLAGTNATASDAGTTLSVTNLYIQTGSVGGPLPNVSYLDDLYTTQWTANDPTFSIGSIESGSGATRTGPHQVTLANPCKGSFDAAIALPLLDGDTLVVPAGSCTWTDPLTWTTPQNFTIQGATSCTGTGHPGTNNLACVDNTVITDAYVSTNPTLKITAGGGTFRMTGMTFIGSSDSTAPHSDGLIQLFGTTSTRIDHNHFNFVPAYGQQPTMTIYDSLGVVDHNIFELPSGPGNGVRFYSSNGDPGWHNPTNFGGADFFFVEDNQFNGGNVGGNGSSANDCHGGQKYVWRYNTTASVQEHGTSTRARGCRAAEIYGNNFTNTTGTASPQFTVAFLSSGPALVWGNDAGNVYVNFYTMECNRRTNVPYPETPPPGGWGYCGTDVGLPGSGTNWDGNTITTNGYPCLDQLGRGVGDLLSGDFPTVINTTNSGANYSVPGAWPRQALEPIYDWLNTWSAPPSWLGHYLNNQNSDVIVANRDYYFSTGVATGSPITTGVQTGPGAPTMGCTVGVGYWNTANSTLYKCTSTNVWSSYYTPYVYPHPLVSGSAPVAPTISSLSPVSGQSLTTADNVIPAVLSGTGFSVSIPTIVFSGTGVTAENIVVVNDTTINFNIRIAQGTAP